MNAVAETDFGETVWIFTGMVDKAELVSGSSSVDNLICRISFQRMRWTFIKGKKK
jgi:hypothetical protein